MAKRSRLLFISHDASRTGAPILLIHLLKSFKKRNPNVEINILVGVDGPLIKEFQSIGNVFVVKKKEKPNGSIVARGIKFLRVEYLNPINFLGVKNATLKSFVKGGFDLVFSNTITNGELLHKILPLNCRVVTYVHELENSIKFFTTPKALEYSLRYTNHFLVPSLSVKENLKKNHSIKESKISRLSYFIPHEKISEKRIEEIREKVNSKNKFIVGAIGTSDWRKGIDLFIVVALQVKKKFPELPVKFVWVGVSKNSIQYERLLYDVENASLKDAVTFIESVENPKEYLAAMDLFLLTSREDPYPLVVLEAAMLGKPIICFDKSGGAPEFLFGGSGVIVSYLDVLAMAEMVFKIVEDKKFAKETGAKAKKKYLELHSEEVAVTTFEKHLNGFSN